MRFDAIVVGAGLAGATAARILAEREKKVLVIEQRNHVGGNCHDYKNEYGITVHSYGPHIFRTGNKNVWDFLNRFTKFNYYQHRVISYVDGRFVPFPINRDTICQLFGIDIPSEEVENFLKKEVERSKFEFPPKNLEDFLISQIGERLYEAFFKNYTMKQWNRPPKELLPETVARIQIRSNRDDRYFTDRYQGIPIYGYTKMVENMLDHDNISIMLNVDYSDLRDAIDAELTVYTGQLDRFFGYKYGKLEYRSLNFELATYDLEYYQPVATVNYPNDYDWTRITEYKHFLGERSSKTTVCFEYPRTEGEPYYIVLTNENMEKRNKYMEEVKELEKTGKYIFVGRLGEGKYYSMDQVVESSASKIMNYKFR